MRTHTHAAEEGFHLMVFPQKFSARGFSSPIFSSLSLSPPPILEAGLYERAEEASELAEELP